MSTSASETTSVSSNLSTPESTNVIALPEDLDVGHSTPKQKQPSSRVEGLMLPPPVPSTAIFAPTPPRMTRLPSLKELSDRLHSSPHTTPASPIRSEFNKPVTPPKSYPSGQSSTSSPIFMQSPSSRLKLPPSAMKRSLSATSSNGTLSTLSSLSEVAPTVRSISPSDAGETSTSTSKPSDIFDVADPFASTSTERPGMSRGASKDGYIQGYKDVPSLAVIRDRVGPVKPGVEIDVQKVADVSPTGEASSSKQKTHPLRHVWTLYFDSKSYKPDLGLTTPKEGEAFLGDYELSLVTVGKIDTVEGFARHLNNIRLPSQLARNSNYHLFKNGIRPMWEDPANAKGGKWVVLFRSAPPLLDAAWANLSMALIGEILDPDDEVCGLVASTRPKIDRIQVWTRGRDDVDRINGIGRRIMEALCLEGRDYEAMSMEFQFNASNSNPPPNKYIHIPFPAPRASFSHAPPTPSRLSFASPGLTISPNPSPRADRLAVAGQIQIPLSPTSPTPNGGMLQAPPPLRRVGSGQGPNAFTGPMGGAGFGIGRGSMSGGGGMGNQNAHAVAIPAGMTR